MDGGVLRPVITPTSTSNEDGFAETYKNMLLTEISSLNRADLYPCKADLEANQPLSLALSRIELRRLIKLALEKNWIKDLGTQTRSAFQVVDSDEE